MTLPALRRHGPTVLGGLDVRPTEHAILGTTTVAIDTPRWNTPPGDYAFVVINRPRGWEVQSVVLLTPQA